MIIHKSEKSPSLNSSVEDGIYAAVLMPMHADLSCNTDELFFHCHDLLKRGCKGVVLFGTTGEGSSFSIEERLDILDRVLGKGIDPKHIIIGSGSANIPEMVTLAKGAIKKQCTRFLIAPPSFFKNVSEEGVIAFYKEIIQRISHPQLRVLLYHIPQFSGVPITLKIIDALTQEFPECVIGMKESEGNLPFAKTVIEAFPGFKVFVANELQIVEAVHTGAAGAICGFPNLYPELICSLYTQGKRALSENPKELKDAMAAIKQFHFIPAFKAIMEKRRGSIWHAVRPPLMPLSSEQRNALSSILE